VEADAELLAARRRRRINLSHDVRIPPIRAVVNSCCLHRRRAAGDEVDDKADDASKQEKMYQPATYEVPATAPHTEKDESEDE
jgi:hypothetical protein